MRVVCTSNEALSFDPTVHDTATHYHLSFAADTSDREPGVESPSPSLSLSVVMTAEDAGEFSTGAVYELELTPAPVPGTAEGAKAEAAAREANREGREDPNRPLGDVLNDPDDDRAYPAARENDAPNAGQV